MGYEAEKFGKAAGVGQMSLLYVTSLHLTEGSFPTHDDLLPTTGVVALKVREAGVGLGYSQAGSAGVDNPLRS